MRLIKQRYCEEKLHSCHYSYWSLKVVGCGKDCEYSRVSLLSAVRASAPKHATQRRAALLLVQWEGALHDDPNKSCVGDY